MVSASFCWCRYGRRENCRWCVLIAILYLIGALRSREHISSIASFPGMIRICPFISFDIVVWSFPTLLPISGIPGFPFAVRLSGASIWGFFFFGRYVSFPPFLAFSQSKFFHFFLPSLTSTEISTVEVTLGIYYFSLSLYESEKTQKRGWQNCSIVLKSILVSRDDSDLNLPRQSFAAKMRL